MKQADNDPRWQALQAQLRPPRRLRWVVLVVELALLAVCLPAIVQCPDLWWTYAISLVAVLGWFHVFPALLIAEMSKPEARVGRHGDSWQIGRYSEAELRRLIDEAFANLPAPLRRVEVRIVSQRGSSAWTTLSMLWPRPDGNKVVSLTNGLLHYLSPDELKAVILHEIGHHLAEHRLAAPGGWLLADVSLHALVFRLCGIPGLGVIGVVSVFILARILLTALFAGFLRRNAQAVEHLCDRFAASQVGSPAVINALFKMGEDDELTEVVLLWVAKEVLYDQGLDLDDLPLAFHEARPYGRIFHENLLRHAAETVKILRGENQDGKKKSRKPNPELDEFIQQRRDRRIRRIRWRSFDADGDGQLTTDEIAALCDALRRHPDHVLVTSRDEAEPTTHPPFRARVLLLEKASPPAI